MVSRNIAWAVVPCLCFRVFPTTFICNMAYSATLLLCNCPFGTGGRINTLHNMSDEGTFGKAFKREVGKNTGKVFSNFLFGDSWSTPHRVAHEKAKIKGENDKLKIEAEQKRKDNEQIYLVDAAVLQNIDKVAAFRLSHSREELLCQIDELTIQLSANKYHDVSDDEKEARVRNKFNDALMEKYKQALIILQTIAPTEPMLKYYKKAYRKAIRSKHWRKHRVLLIFLSFILFYFLFLAIISN